VQQDLNQRLKSVGKQAASLNEWEAREIHFAQCGRQLAVSPAALSGNKINLELTA